MNTQKVVLISALVLVSLAGGAVWAGEGVPVRELVSGREGDLPLIGRHNPALVRIEEICVAEAIGEPNGGKLETVLQSINSDARAQLSAAGLEVKTGRSSGAVNSGQLRVVVDTLEPGDTNEVVFHIQVYVGVRLCLPGHANLYVNADIWKSGGEMGSVSVAGLDEAIRAVAAEQVKAFIGAWSVAKESQPERSRRSAETRRPRAEVREAEEEKAQPQADAPYVASKRSEVFHKADCSSAKRISPENLVSYGSREEAIADGKRPCRRCNP